MIRRIKSWLRQIIWKRLDLQWVLPSGVKIVINCKSDWYIYNEIFVDGDYDLPIRSVLDSCKETGRRAVILDLGANVGFFGLRWLDLANRSGSDPGVDGHFIEGAPDVCDELINRLSSYCGESFNGSFLNGLVGKKSGSAAINLSDAHFGNSVVVGSTGRYNTVNFVDLEVLCESWPSVSLIKCDIEGSELDFLENFSPLLKKTDRLVIEFHKHLVNVERCYQLIENVGFLEISVLKERDDFCVVYFEQNRDPIGYELPDLPMAESISDI